MSQATPANDPQILVALDYATAKDSLALAGQLDPQLCRLKVGKELFTACGPSIVEQLQQLGFDVFLDLKFHDIPNTVAKALASAADLGVWMVNVHASGGQRMLAAARESLDRRSGHRPLLIAVTLLTSMEAGDLPAIGIKDAPETQVLRLARLARDCGLDGVVCSPLEAASLRRELGAPFCLVTPGIRAEAAAADDQRRVMTPRQALAAGSNYLVIGRPITGAADPAEACRAIAQSLNH